MSRRYDVRGRSWPTILAMLFAVSHVAAAQCGVEPKALPSFPSQDPSILNPRENERSIITRAENSELVDLGHPGAQYSSPSTSNCPHTSSGLTSWSSGVTWNGNSVSVKDNTRVLLTACDVSPGQDFGVISIPPTSELIFADEAIHITANGVHVQGALRAGSETCRLQSEISITLTGARPASIYDRMDEWYKGINVDGGTLELHGAEYYQTWSRLAATVRTGERMLLLQDRVNWEPGMSIVVTTTALKDSRDWHQNEELTIDKVRAADHLGADVTAVYVSENLKYDHYAGEYQAEVGLLTRRIKIQGDALSEPWDVSDVGCRDDRYASYPCENSFTTGYGGHVIVHNDARAKVSGVEFFRMGQTNFEGRYPLHWHLVGDRPEDFVQDSSFHRLFFKCVTLHGVHSVRVSRNVAYDAIGHCLYIEDGVETENVIEYNLHAHIHPIGKPPGNGGSDQYLAHVKNSPQLSTPSDSTASGFYIPNAYNSFKGNAAVGGYSGYHFPIFKEGLGLHRDADVIPRNTYLIEFDGNSCRSSGFWWGNAGCIYMGGELWHDTAERNPMTYNPGRTINGWRPCLENDSTWCSFSASKCPGGWPDGCYEYLTVTNFKAALANVGIMNWGNRGRYSKIEVHDFIGGPGLQVFGDNSIDETLITCRTANFPAAPQWCDGTMLPHEGDQEAVSCKWFDKRAWRTRGRAIQWYDTGMNTIYSRTTIRTCDPVEWPGCQGNCLDFGIFETLTHSNQFLPEVMSLVAETEYQDDARVLDHVVSFNSASTTSISGRTAAWFDIDGTSCLRGDWGPSIIGSNHDAGNWWHLENDCVPLSRGAMYCCRAANRQLASFSMHVGLDGDLMGNGGSECENGSRESHSACPRVGYVAKFGDADLASGLKLMKRSEIVGAVPTYAAETGFGWYVYFDEGAPKRITLDFLQVHTDAILVLAMSYPKGTTFDITMDGASWCGWGKFCHHTYTRVFSLRDVWDGPGDTYFVQQGSNADVLFLRVVTRPNDGLSETSEWDADWEAPMFTSAYIDDLPGKKYWGLPYRGSTPTITIDASCSAGSVYCHGGALPVEIPPLFWSSGSGVTPRPTLSPTPPQPTPEATPKPSGGRECTARWGRCSETLCCAEAGDICYLKKPWGYMQCRPEGNCPPPQESPEEQANWECGTTPSPTPHPTTPLPTPPAPTTPAPTPKPTPTPTLKPLGSEVVSYDVRHTTTGEVICSMADLLGNVVDLGSEDATAISIEAIVRDKSTTFKVNFFMDGVCGQDDVSRTEKKWPYFLFGDDSVIPYAPSSNEALKECDAAYAITLAGVEKDGRIAPPLASSINVRKSGCGAVACMLSTQVDDRCPDPTPAPSPKPTPAATTPAPTPEPTPAPTLGPIGSEVLAYNVRHTSTGDIICTMSDLSGKVVDLGSEPATALTVEAIVRNRATTARVNFYLDGVCGQEDTYRTEGMSPYFLFGDDISLGKPFAPGPAQAMKACESAYVVTMTGEETDGQSANPLTASIDVRKSGCGAVACLTVEDAAAKCGGSTPPPSAYPGILTRGMDLSTMPIMPFAYGNEANEYEVVMNGMGLQVWGETWVALELPTPVTTTKYSTFSFCYSSGNEDEGSFHAIAPTGDVSSLGFGTLFSIEGGNYEWSRLTTFYRAQSNKAPWTCFDIPLDTFWPSSTVFTHVGTIHSDTPPEYSGTFAALSIKENIECTSSIDMSSLAVQDFTSWGNVNDTYVVEQGGCSIYLSDKTYKAFDLGATYTVAPDTRFQFCFQQSYKCSKHAISPTNNPNTLNGGPIFELGGWNKKWSRPIRDFTYSYEQIFFGVECFEVPLAEYMDVGATITAVAFLNSCNRADRNDARWSKIRILN